MNKVVIKIVDISTENHKFYYNKNPILRNLDKILISNKVSCKKGYKYFIRYKNSLLYSLLPQISECGRNVDENTCTSSLT